MRRAAVVLLVFVAAWAATVALQIQGGAYAAEFTETSDEAAHYVTGLLAHDYVAAGMPRPIAAFYKRFCQHYANVGIGHWPPGFYVLQAAWTLAFGVSRDSLLVLMAFCNAAFLTGTFLLIRNALSTRYALGASLLLLTIPAAQVSARSVMGEAPMAAIELGAVAVYGAYLKREKPAYAAVFGLLAAAALLTKGTGILLAAIPILAVLLLRRFRLLGRWHFWLPAAIVLAVCVPWYLKVPGALHDRVAFLGGISVVPESVPETFEFLRSNLGAGVLAAAVAGYLLAARAVVRNADVDPVWPLALAVVSSAVLFRAFVVVWEPRHLLTAMPWLLLLAAGAIRRGVARAGWIAGAAAGASILALALYPAWNVWSMPKKAHLGLDEAALGILATPEMEKSALLIISDLRGEGVFTAEIAGHERRPGHRVLRGSDALAHTSFLGTEYAPRFRDAASLMRYLAGLRPLAVVLDDPAEPYPHAALVKEAIAKNESAWRRVGAHDGARGVIEIWRLD